MNEDKIVEENIIESLIEYYKILRMAERSNKKTLLACLNPELESIIQMQ